MASPPMAAPMSACREPKGKRFRVSDRTLGPSQPDRTQDAEIMTPSQNVLDFTIALFPDRAGAMPSGSRHVVGETTGQLVRKACDVRLEPMLDGRLVVASRYACPQ